MSQFHPPRLALAVLAALTTMGALLLSCDDDPTDAESECADPSASCLPLTLTSDQVTYSRWDVPGATVHWLKWDLGDGGQFEYGPGRHIRIHASFNPPVKVRYDHGVQRFDLATDSLIYWDGLVDASATALSQNWTIGASHATCYGLADSDQQALHVSMTFEPMVVDEEIRALVIEFTVPDTYTMGDRFGEPLLSEVLTIRHVAMSTVLEANQTNPPVWQGEYLPTSK